MFLTTRSIKSILLAFWIILRGKAWYIILSLILSVRQDDGVMIANQVILFYYFIVILDIETKEIRPMYCSFYFSSVLRILFTF